MDKYFLGKISTFPLTEESVFHHSHLVSEMNMLPSSQRIRENICYLLISRNVLQLYNSSLNIVFDEVVFDLNVFRPVMKHWILRELDATMIIIVNDSRPQLLTILINHELAKPQGLATSLTGCHVLSLCRTQRNEILLSTEP